MAITDVEAAIATLAKEKIRQLLGRGADAPAKLEEMFTSSLRNLPPSLLATFSGDFEILKRHSHRVSPSIPGLYLKLLHGRETMVQEMSDWGSNGPWIGPLKWFHCTYMVDIGLGFTGGEEVGPFGPNGNPPAPIFIENGLLYFDGMYYGDWELQQK